MRIKSLAYFMVPIILLATITFASSISIAAASADTASLNRSLLNASVAEINCKTNLTVTFLNNVATSYPNTTNSISPLITSIKEDNAQLQSYAQSGNMSSFRSYVSGTYDPEISAINTEARKDIRGNVSGTTVHSLKVQFNATRSTYQQCALPALKEFGNDKVAAYKAEIAGYAQTVSALSSNGVQTSALNQTISNANSTIIIPLQNAINSATNVSQLESAINGYCLFDGCRNGIDYHLAANFATEKITAIINKAETMNLTANQTSALSSAKADIAISTSTLQTVGTSRYKDGQNTTIWSNIRNASVLVRHALK